MTSLPDPTFPLAAGALVSKARALQETARQTRERTLAMRQENQALLARVRQQMSGRTRPLPPEAPRRRRADDEHSGLP